MKIDPIQHRYLLEGITPEQFRQLQERTKGFISVTSSGRACIRYNSERSYVGIFYRGQDESELNLILDIDDLRSQKGGASKADMDVIEDIHNRLKREVDSISLRKEAWLD